MKRISITKMKKIKLTKTLYLCCTVMLISIFFGVICDLLYNISPKYAVGLSEFKRELNSKENEADEHLKKIYDIIVHASVDSLNHIKFNESDISYYVFSKNEMIFWSDNNLKLNSNLFSKSSNWQLVQLPNAYCLSKTIFVDSTSILALIKLKNNYPYENDELINTFSKGFRIDKQVQIEITNKSDQYAVSDQNNNYLFSLKNSKQPIYNEFWSELGLFFYVFSLIIFFIIYTNLPLFTSKKIISSVTFLIISGFMTLVFGVLLYFNIPDLLFSNKLFTPIQYASNPILSSISHLTVLTAFFISSICLYFFYTKNKFLNSFLNRILLQFICVIYFIIAYYILSSLINHSSIQLNILHFNDFSAISIWIHFLMLIWGIGLTLLFFKTHQISRNKVGKLIITDLILILIICLIIRFISMSDSTRITFSIIGIWFGFYIYIMFSKTKNLYIFSLIWIFFYCMFLICNTIISNNDRKFSKYKIIAQNTYSNGSSENDQMADILLEDLNLKIQSDKKIARFLIRKDSIQQTNDYLNKTYFRGYWSKYEMRLNIVNNKSKNFSEYAGFISKTGNQIKNTHFYSIPTNENNMTYIGHFQYTTLQNDSISVFMEFYPRKNFRSYSFPNLLISTTANIQAQLNISIAKYERGRLIYSTGKIEYPVESSWIPSFQSDYVKFNALGHDHFIYAPNPYTYIVVSEQKVTELLSYFLYFLYTFLGYYVICSLLIWTYSIAQQKWNYRIGLTSRFQFTFILLLLISFIGIFYVSVNFIEEKYKEQQIANLENKKNYIQKALQDMYYWNQDLNEQNSQTLNFDLQDLSYLYHTDIHVYDNRGKLIASSQPIIFNKNLISNQIASTPFFSSNSNLNQYEYIGKLKYLNGYTDFYNGDFLQIGFIAIPQFFSQDEIKSEIESFLSVIIHIYLIIILLAILLSLIIGKQLSIPLILLESKLKEMRFGRRNEKIDYALNDEIGQLVVQYNRTIDELDRSAKLLAQSERESAWKMMARQVAHEINNPLTPMKLTIQQLQRTKNANKEEFDSYFGKSTVVLIEQIDNLSRIAATFSDFARMPEANFERVDIAEKLYSVYQLFEYNNEHIKLIFEGINCGVFVLADPEQLVQVFNNLIKNAIQSIPGEREGFILVSLNCSDTRIYIKISDNGNGIENNMIDKLFMPNFTTKSTGMGLGLAISKNIIELTGGLITFNTELNKGTTFNLEFPIL